MNQKEIELFLREYPTLRKNKEFIYGIGTEFFFKVVDGLLNLYNEEKQKNAELEAECMIQKYTIIIDEQELISKDAIRKLIKDKCYKGTYNFETIRVSDLEELLNDVN